MYKYLIPSILFVVVLAFSGCTGKQNIKIENTKKFTLEDIDLNKGEQIVYFIRNYKFRAGGIDNFVECNNKRFLLENGEYTYCKIKKGINTISYGKYTPGLFLTPILKSENTYSSQYITHDFSNDKYLFMEIKVDDYKGMMFLKISKDEALKYLKNADLDFHSPIDNGINGNNLNVSLLNPSMTFYFDSKIKDFKIKSKILDDYQISVEKEFQTIKKEEAEKKEIAEKEILNDPMAHQEFQNIVLSDREIKKQAQKRAYSNMSDTEKINYILEPSFMRLDNKQNKKLDKNKSKIVLFRNSDNGNLFTGIWTKEDYIGSLMRQSYIELETDKDELTFYTNYAKWEFLNIKLEKGKTYYVNIDFSMGWENNSIELSKSNKKEFEKEKLYKIYKNSNLIPDNYNIRIDEAIKLINNTDFSSIK